MTPTPDDVRPPMRIEDIPAEVPPYIDWTKEPEGWASVQEPPMPSVDEVREAINDIETMSGALWRETHESVKVLVDFADAVLTPPTSVRLAIRAKTNGPNRKLANEIIADWIVSLIGPNAKETT